MYMYMYMYIMKRTLNPNSVYGILINGRERKQKK